MSFFGEFKQSIKKDALVEAPYVKGNEIEIRVQLTLDDCRRFMMQFKNIAVCINFFLGLYGVFFMDFVVRSLLGISAYKVSFSDNPVPFLLFAFVVLAKVSMNIAVSKVYQSNPLLRLERVYQFSSKCVKVVDSSGKNSYWWNDFYAASQTADCFSLMSPGNTIFIIPKRLLTQEQIGALAELIKCKLGAKAFAKERMLRLSRNFIRAIFVLIALALIVNLVSDVIMLFT